MNEMTTQTAGGDLSSFLPTTSSPALQIMLNDKMFDRARMIAGYLAKAKGFVPKHLEGQEAACFAVVTRSITWKLDPYAVAQSTYQTPGGTVGYEGRLCQAILENSGQLEGGVKYEHFGDWSKVQARFQMKPNNNGKTVPTPDWTPEDEEGLGVIVSAQIKGEAEPRKLEFLLKQAHPRNSTLWAIDPKTQICYTAVRRFASVATPHLFMGVPFDREDMEYVGPDNARDITPDRPKRSDYEAEPEQTDATEAANDQGEDAAAEPEQEVDSLYDLIDEVGEPKFENQRPGEFVSDYCTQIGKLTNLKDVEQFIENNEAAVADIVERSLVDAGAAILAEAQQKARAKFAEHEPAEEPEDDASGAEDAAETAEEPSPWYVECPEAPQRSGQCMRFVTDIKTKLDQCRNTEDFLAFLAANSDNIERINTQFKIDDLKTALETAEANAA